MRPTQDRGSRTEAESNGKDSLSRAHITDIDGLSLSITSGGGRPAKTSVTTPSAQPYSISGELRTWLLTLARPKGANLNEPLMSLGVVRLRRG